MKKSLIALAALSAFAATAQAQSSVTVYGIIDTGYNSIENKTSGTGATSKETTGVQGNAGANTGEASSSRLGFRGTEDLGGGLKANFVVETNMRQNDAPNFGRQYWVGLEDAKMGELRIGFQDTFARNLWLANDQLAAANVAGNLAHSDAQGDASTTSHTNRNTAINYFSPRMNGIQLSLGVTQSEVDETGKNKVKNGSGSQVGLNYTAGKFSAGLAYVEATTAANTVAAVAADAAKNPIVVGSKEVPASDTKTKDTAAAASYDLGFAKVAYVYNKRELNNRAAGSTTNNTERESHAFSASVPLTAKLVGRLGYGFGDYRADTKAVNGYKGDLKGYQAALNYNLSKRTTVYGIYGNEKRDTDVNKDVETKEYSVGVRHSF
jgi:predicted porin